MLQRENVMIVGETQPFADRYTAGMSLTSHVADYIAQQTFADIVVLGLPKGGMAVAAPIAEGINRPLDFVITRKLVAPHQPQLVIGAVTERGRAFLNKPVIDALGVSDEYIQNSIKEVRLEIEASTAAYRCIVPAVNLVGKTVIVADDNVITGSTMFATLRGLWAERPKNIILAIPVAPRETLMALGDFADHVIALQAPRGSFTCMADYYEAYDTVTEEDVIELLKDYVAIVS